MALSLIGLEPSAKRAYSWIGDPACDVAKSAVQEWRDEGTGLVALDGQAMTVLTCEPLRPTTYSVVYGAAEGSFGNIAAVHRLAVAYSVVAIDNGPALRRVSGPGGLRLHDDLLRTLEACIVELKTGDERVRITLLEHLGSLILADSEPTELQKKVLVLRSTPERSPGQQPRSTATGSGSAETATPPATSGPAEGAAQVP